MSYRLTSLLKIKGSKLVSCEKVALKSVFKLERGLMLFLLKKLKLEDRLILKTFPQITIDKNF